MSSLVLTPLKCHSLGLCEFLFTCFKFDLTYKCRGRFYETHSPLPIYSILLSIFFTVVTVLFCRQILQCVNSGKAFSGKLGRVRISLL